MSDFSPLLPITFEDKKGRTIKLRPYQERDFSKLKYMYDQFEPKGLEEGLPPIEDHVRDQWLRSLTQSFFNIVAERRGNIIGHAALDLRDPEMCPEYLIFIKQGYRNAGIGTAMSETMREVGKRAGCRKIWLTVRSANTRAIRVFEKVQFRFKGGIDIQREMELTIESKSHVSTTKGRETNRNR